MKRGESDEEGLLCAYVHTHTHTHTHKRTHTHVCICIHTYICMHASLRTFKSHKGQDYLCSRCMHLPPHMRCMYPPPHRTGLSMFTQHLFMEHDGRVDRSCCTKFTRAYSASRCCSRGNPPVRVRVRVRVCVCVPY